MRFQSFAASLAASILISSLIVACGGGGGSSESPDTQQTGTVSGVAFDAELANASVTISSYDRSKYYGTTATDTDGKFSIDVVTAEDQVLRIDTAGGSYVDEYTGRTDQEFFGQTKGALRLYLNYTAGTSLNLAPTIYTTLAANLADYLVEQGTPVSDAVNQANASISNVVGVNIETTIPHNVTVALGDADSDESIRYGFYSAAISALMAAQNIAPYVTSINFTTYAGADLRDDGLLNESTPDGYAFDGGYRHALAVSMLQMVISNRNATGFTLSDVLPFAEQLNDNTNGVFGGLYPVPLNVEKPLISNVEWNHGQITTNIIYGTVTLSFDVGDVIGVQDVVVTLDGNALPSVDMQNPSIEIDTTQYSDDEHSVSITATNVLGYSTSEELKVHTINNGTAITDVSPQEGVRYRGTMPMYADIHDPTGIVYVGFYIDGSITEYAAFDDGDIGHYERNFYSDAYSDGDHTLTIRATNGVGVITEKAINFVTDNTPADAAVWLSENSYIEGTPSILVTHEIDSSVQVSIGGQAATVQSSSTANGFDWTYFSFNTAQLDDGPYALLVSTTDEVGNEDTKTLNVIVDNTPPALRVTYPLDDGSITGEFYLSWIVSDANGFGNNPFEILVDGRHYSWVSNWEITDSVNPAIFGVGWHDVSIKVTDVSGKITTVAKSVFFDI